MKQTKTYVIIAVICASFLSPTDLRGQTVETVSVEEILKELGFEDIKAKLQQDTLFATIENRSYRGTFRGAATAIQCIAEQQPDINQFELILTDYKMPQLIVHASRRGGIWDVRVDREMKQTQQMLKTVKPQAASTGKIDISFIPMISLVNNKLDHLFDYSVRLAPAIAATLWKGSRLTIQPIFPIINNLGVDDTKRYIQIGNASLRQQIISNKRWLLTATGGFFNAERVGVNAQVGFHAIRGLDFYFHAGYTLKANYTHQNGFGITRNSGKLDFMAKADYYEHHTKLQIELQGGRFLYGDYGARLDVIRHFSEYAIGIYGILTGGKHNFGFHFAIPMGGKRQKRTWFVRPRLPEYFNMEYSMETNPQEKYYGEHMGEYYTTQPDQNHAAHYWEPRFVEEYIQRILNGEFK